MQYLGNSRTNEVLVFGSFRLFAAERLLKKGEESLPIRGRALDLLITLVQRAGEVITYRELSTQVWPDVTVQDINLRVHIAALRKVLDDGRGAARYIANVAGQGYCFVAQVQRQPQEVASKAPTGPGKTRMLPAHLRRMIGRDDIVETLSSLISSQRFVSIVGSGGMGKTTLALAVAHKIATDFGNAICFVDLAALNDGALVVPTVASAVGCLNQTQDSLTALLAFLADKRMLLILDSCEHLLNTVAPLAEHLFLSAPFMHIVVTSREPLRVKGENIYWLQPLRTPPRERSLTSADVLAFSAAQLFMERAAAGGYLEYLGDQDAPLVASICCQLDGIPLAIELTASQVNAYGIRGLSELINDRRALYWPGRRTSSRHQTLQATLDWSYDLLSEYEKTVLCRLSRFVGPFTLEAAQTVAAEPDSHASDFTDVIRKLVDKSLVLLSSAEDQNFHRLLDTTRAYAAVKLAERGEENAIARRHALYYAERLATIRPSFLQNHTFSAYSQQVGDVRAALQWSFSISGDIRVGLALGVGAAPLLLNLSMLNECQHWSRKIISALDESFRGTQRELTLQASLAMSSMFARGDREEVNNSLERGIALAEALRDTEQLPHLLAGLNLFRMRLGDFAGALAAAQRYLVAANEFGGPREKIVGEWMLGGSQHLIGNQAEARQHYESGFERAAAAGVTRSYYFGFDHELWARIGLARTLWLRGFPDQAVAFANSGIQSARGEGHPVTLCICLIYGTQLFQWRGDDRVAAGLIDELIAIAEKHSLAPYHACGLVRLGELLVAQGETAAGIETLRRARSILAAEGNSILFPAISCSLAEGLVRNGRSEEALDVIKAAVTDVERGAGTFELPELLRVKANVLLAVSPVDRTAAESSLLTSLHCARKQSALGWELRSATALFNLLADHERADTVRGMLAQIYGRYTEGFETSDLRAARVLLNSPA